MDVASAADEALQTLRGDVINIVLGTVFLTVGGRLSRSQQSVGAEVFASLYCGEFSARHFKRFIGQYRKHDLL
jgi:hypothetical protein